MAMGLLETLLVSAGMFALVLIVLLFVWGLRPKKHNPGNPVKRKKIREDLKKIKDQINGE